MLNGNYFNNNSNCILNMKERERERDGRAVYRMQRGQRIYYPNSRNNYCGNCVNNRCDSTRFSLHSCNRVDRAEKCKNNRDSYCSQALLSRWRCSLSWDLDFSFFPGFIQSLILTNTQMLFAYCSLYSKFECESISPASFSRKIADSNRSGQSAFVNILILAISAGDERTFSFRLLLFHLFGPWNIDSHERISLTLTRWLFSEELFAVFPSKLTWSFRKNFPPWFSHKQ